MFIYLTIFSYYLFLCAGIFYFIRFRSNYRYIKIKNRSNMKKNISAIIKKINLFSTAVGRLFRSRYRIKNSKEGIELFKKLESENRIFLTPDSFMGYKIILSVLCMAAAFFIGSNLISSIILGVVGGAAGYFAPNILLKRFEYTRQKEIEKDLPYVIDLLSVATLSGQNIYNAIKIVIDKYRGYICGELSNFIKDIDIGIGKPEAYRNLMYRSSSEDFKNLFFSLSRRRNMVHR